MDNSTTTKGLARLFPSSLKPFLSLPHSLSESLPKFKINSQRFGPSSNSNFNFDKITLQPSSKPVLITLILLALTCLLYLRPNAHRWHRWITSHKPKSKDLGAGSGSEAAKRKVSNSKSNEEKEEGELDADPFRECDFSNVKVSKILIHPIKSCRGTSVQEARYDGKGLEFDRQLAIIDARTHRVITAREKPQMVLIYPQIVDNNKNEADGNPVDGGGLVVISFPENSGCETFAIPLRPSEETLRQWKRLDDVELWGQDDIDGYICESVSSSSSSSNTNDNNRTTPSEIISRFLARDVYLVLKGARPRPCEPTLDFPQLEASANYQDGYPLLVASEESLGAVQTRMRTEVGKQGVAERWKEDDLVMERFRPNIVLRGAGVPWAEDVWENIRIGTNSSSIALVSKCTRCLLPNVDPETGVRDAAVPYKVLMKFRTGKDPARLSKPCFGCNGVPSGPGVVRVGDRVTVLSRLGWGSD